MPRFLRQMGARNACAGALRTHGASGGRGDAPAAAGAGARGGASAGRCAGAWPGGDSCGVPRAAFLAPDGRSKRSRGGVAHPWRERWARERACRDGSGRARRTARRLVRAGPGVRRGGMPRFLRQRALETLAPPPFAAKSGPCHSERRVGMGPARKRAATKPIMRTARAAAHGGRTCEATFFRQTVDKAKRWCYHSCKQRRRRQSRYESSTHGPQLRLLLYLWLYVCA